MKKYKIFIFLFVVITPIFSQDAKNQVIGTVTDSDNRALPQVNIVIKGTSEGTKTDEFGKYSLIAHSGDVFLFTHVGMQSVERKIEKTPSIINISMLGNNIELEEVEIEAKKKYQTQKDLLRDFYKNKNLIKTSWGIFDKDRFSGSIRIIDGNELINAPPDFLTSLNNFVPNMRVVRNDPKDPGRIFVYLSKLAYSSNPTVIFDVDGFIYQDPPTYLTGGDIERVAILERNSAISKYGPSGVGGVIVINTKAKAWSDELTVDRTYEKNILLDSLIFEVSNLEPYTPIESIHLEELKRVRNRKRALALYETQKQKFLDDPYYFLEIYDYFLSRWGNLDGANMMFKEIIDRFPSDVQVLKALAYIQEQYGNHKSALSLYLKILHQRPDKAQSHRDVANAFAETGDFRNALIRYVRFKNSISQLINVPFDSYGVDMLMTTEIMNIIAQNRDTLLEKGEINDININGLYEGTRLVFEWNNPKAEFELQFISPDKYYDTWKNYLENKASKKSFTEGRYDSKQFFVENNIKGRWIINLNYHGNQSNFPTFLKLSLYHNFGMPNQSLQLKVFRLSEKVNKIELFRFLQ